VDTCSFLIGNNCTAGKDEIKTERENERKGKQLMGRFSTEPNKK